MNRERITVIIADIEKYSKELEELKIKSLGEPGIEFNRMFKIFVLSSFVLFLIPVAFAAVQSHPLSQLYPIDIKWLVLFAPLTILFADRKKNFSTSTIINLIHSAVAQLQSHLLSEITPIDVNLNMFQKNMTNVMLT